MSRMEVGRTQQTQQDSKKCSLSNEGDKGRFDILSSLSCHAITKKIVNIPEYIGYRKGHAGCEKKENIVIKNERCDIFVIS